MAKQKKKRPNYLSPNEKTISEKFWRTN